MLTGFTTIRIVTNFNAVLLFQLPPKSSYINSRCHQQFFAYILTLKTHFYKLFFCFQFRCPLSYIEGFKTGKLPLCAPGKGYANTLIRGLVEGKRLSQEEAIAYIEEASSTALWHFKLQSILLISTTPCKIMNSSVASSYIVFYLIL